MKKQHIFLIAAAILGTIVGTAIVLAAVLTTSSDSPQPAAETQTATPVDIQTEAEKSLSTILTDAEFVKAMSEEQQGRLIAIICLATEQGNSPEDVAESIAESFDEISEDYAQRFVDAALITVCPDARE